MCFSLIFSELIWKYLLRLPENTDHYTGLLDKGDHVSFKDLRSKFPVKSDKIFRSLSRYAINEIYRE
jgi:hypothetical protein